MFDVLKAPLRIANASGTVLGVAKTLAQAVEASGRGLRLLASRRYDDDLTALNGFKPNCSTALRIKATRALANDAGVIAEYGPLELVNSGEEVKLRLTRTDQAALELAPDGLVMATSSSAVLFNSVKHTPSEDDIARLLADAAKLERMLSDFSAVTSTPPNVKMHLQGLLPSIFGPRATTTQLRGRFRVVPFLSGDNFSASVAAECEQMGAGVVRPSGEGFVAPTVL